MACEPPSSEIGIFGHPFERGEGAEAGNRIQKAVSTMDFRESASVLQFNFIPEWGEIDNMETAAGESSPHLRLSAKFYHTAGAHLVTICGNMVLPYSWKHKT